MADVKVNFMHPTDGRVVSVEVDSSMTAAEAIAELITNNFMTPHSDGYTLAIKGGSMLQTNQTFQAAGVKPNDTIRVVPATDAGY